MRECERIQELISLLLDGELSEAEEQTVREHIADCAECREMYEAFAAVSDAMRADAAPVPDGLHEKIMDGVRAAGRKKPGRVIHLRRYVTAAACLVVILGAVLALGRGGMGFDSAASTANSAAAPAAVDYRSSETAADNESAVLEEYGWAEMPSTQNMMETGESNGTVEDQVIGPQLSGFTAEDPTILSARFVWEEEERAVEDLDALAGLLEEQPAESAEDDFVLSENADCLLCLETSEGEQELSLYFRDGKVYVQSEDGSVYLAAGSAEEFLALGRDNGA
ncbi:MAG: zf-HC2 domain-containing protein [Oscillospiraceae bacterium]